VETDTQPDERPAGESPDTPSIAADPGTEDATASDQSPHAQQADDPAEEEATEFASAAQEQLIKNWPTLDQGDSYAISRARRWPLWVAILALVGGGGLFATRLHAAKRQALASSRSAAPVAAAPTASVSPASAGGQAVAEQAVAQTVDPMAGLHPTTVRVDVERQGAALADAGTKPENMAEHGSPLQVVSGETSSREADDDQAEPAPLGAARRATEGLGERCRKADARGKGNPAAVMAACRPAVEAEPEAADILVMLARVQLELGRPGEARSWAKKALQGKRDLPDAYVYLGGAEQEMGRPAEAKTAYRKYLELAPTGSHASDLRAILDHL
jgi:hypothetical protein